MKRPYIYNPRNFYEVHFHGWVELPDGSLTADHGGEPTSLCVYVREYELEDSDTWEALEEEDFTDPTVASARAEELAAKYGNCGIDEF